MLHKKTIEAFIGFCPPSLLPRPLITGVIGPLQTAPQETKCWNALPSLALCPTCLLFYKLSKRRALQNRRWTERRTKAQRRERNCQRSHSHLAADLGLKPRWLGPQANVLSYSYCKHLFEYILEALRTVLPQSYQGSREETSEKHP